METDSLEQERLAAKRRLLQLVSSLIALLSLVAGAVIVLQQIDPQKLEVERETKANSMIDWFKKKDYGLRWSEGNRTILIGMNGDGPECIEVNESETEVSETSYLSEGIEFSPQGTPGLFVIKFKCSEFKTDRPSGPPTKITPSSDSEAAKSHDFEIVALSHTEDKAIFKMEKRGERTEREFVVATEDIKQTLLSQVDDKFSSWEKRRQEEAAKLERQRQEEVTRREDEERRKAISGLVEKYPIGEPLCFALGAGLLEKGLNKVVDLNGKNSASAAFASLEFFSDDIIWVTRTGDSSFYVHYRNHGENYPPRLLDADTVIDPKLGISLSCKSDHPVGWRELTINLEKMEWKGTYAYALGEPAFRFELSESKMCWFAIDMPGRIGRFLVKSMDSIFRIDAGRIGGGVVGMDLTEKQIGGVVLYPEHKTPMERVMIDYVRGPLNSKLDIVGYWIDQPDIPVRQLKGVPYVQKIYDSYYFEPIFIHGSYTYVKTVNAAFFRPGAAEKNGVREGSVLKSIRSPYNTKSSTKETIEISEAEFEMLMSDSFDQDTDTRKYRDRRDFENNPIAKNYVVDLQFVDSEAHSFVRSSPVVANEFELMNGSLKKWIASMPQGGSGVYRAMPLTDESLGANQGQIQTTVPLGGLVVQRGTSEEIAKKVIELYYQAGNSDFGDESVQPKLFKADSYGKLPYYGDSVSISDIEGKVAKNFGENPFRRYLVKSMKSSDRGRALVDVVVDFSYQTGKSESRSEEQSSRSFIRVEIQNGAGSIIYINKDGFPD